MIKSSNEIVIAQIGDATHTVGSFVVTTDIEGADVGYTNVTPAGGTKEVWKYYVATKQTFRAEAGEDAVFVEATSSAPAVTFYETSAIPEKNIKTYIGTTIVTPKRPGYSVSYWQGSDNNKYLWKWEADMSAAEIAEGYKPLPEKMPEGGLTLTAVWEPNEYWVIFRDAAADESAAPKAMKKVAYGDLIVVPEGADVKDHYDFGGWFTDKNTRSSTAFDIANTKFMNTDTVTLIPDLNGYAKGHPRL